MLNMEADVNQIVSLLRTKSAKASHLRVKAKVCTMPNGSDVTIISLPPDISYLISGHALPWPFCSSHTGHILLPQGLCLGIPSAWDTLLTNVFPSSLYSNVPLPGWPFLTTQPSHSLSPLLCKAALTSTYTT